MAHISLNCIFFSKEILMLLCHKNLLKPWAALFLALSLHIGITGCRDDLGLQATLALSQEGVL